MAYVPEVSSGIANSQEQLQNDLLELLSTVFNQYEKICSKTDDNKKYYSKALDDIKGFRQQINKLLDKLEIETTKKLSELYCKNNAKLVTERKRCHSIATEVWSMKASLEEMATFNEDNQLFVQLNMTKVRLNELVSEVTTINDKIHQYSVQQSDKCQQLISALLFVWQDNTPTVARHVREVNIKSVDDTEECSISGIAGLTGNRMVVTDHNNNNVKLINMNTSEITHCLSVSSQPVDIAEIKPNQVAVALRYEEKIDILIVSDVLTRSHTINVPGIDITEFCYDGSNKIFLCLCWNHRCVIIIDMYGARVDTYSSDSNGKQLFIQPWCIALDRDNDFIYVTDLEANTVTIMTTNGRVISVYKHDMLTKPCGVVVGKDGSVYVCSYGTNSVHQLSPTGDLMRIILEQARGLANIAYDDEDDRLFISSDRAEETHCIRLFQLE